MKSAIGLMVLGAALVLAAGSTWAKPAARSYSFKCAGEDNSARPAGLAGIIKVTDPTDAIGTVYLNISDGTITFQDSFTATVVNGTAAADGSGGNGIPTNCFTMGITISGDTFGLFSSLFGCYSKSKNGFNAVQRSGAQVTCEAQTM